MINIPTSITGAVMNSLAYVFTVAPDISPNGPYSRQGAVTAVSGTGAAGVTVHSLESPFTYTYTRAAAFKPIQYTGAGTVKAIPLNTNKMIFRKGMKPLPNVTKTGLISIEFSLPAGATMNDPQQVAALYSLAVGWLNAERDALLLTQNSGLM